MNNKVFSVVTRVSEHGVIEPTFNIEGDYTSGHLKYFSKLRLQKVKITIEVLEEKLDNQP